MNNDAITPRNMSTGNFPMLPGTMNFLFAFGFLYLSTIKDMFIIANVKNMNMLLKLAMNSMFFSKAITEDAPNVITIATQGVLFFLATMLRLSGSDFSFAMP